MNAFNRHAGFELRTEPPNAGHGRGDRCFGGQAAFFSWVSPVFLFAVTPGAASAAPCANSAGAKP